MKTALSLAPQLPTRDLKGLVVRRDAPAQRRSIAPLSPSPRVRREETNRAFSVFLSQQKHIERTVLPCARSTGKQRPTRGSEETTPLSFHSRTPPPPSFTSPPCPPPTTGTLSVHPTQLPFLPRRTMAAHAGKGTLSPEKSFPISHGYTLGESIPTTHGYTLGGPQGPTERSSIEASRDGIQGNLAEYPENMAVIIVDHGSRRAESNQNLEKFIQVFQAETGHSVVEPAHMELARPSIADAFAKCVERGAKFIAVCPYFLAPGRHWTQDIPALCSEAAAAHPGISYMVSAPIGAHPLVANILDERMKQCLARSRGANIWCSACDGDGTVGCKILDQKPAHHEDVES